MAKKFYVGVNQAGESYLSTYENNTGIQTCILTNTNYTSYIGFEIEFVYYGGFGSSTSYHYLLNSGGTGNNTKFNLYERSNNFQIEVLIGGTKRTITPAVAKTSGVRYKISNIIDAETKYAHFKVVNVDTGTTVYENTEYYNAGSTESTTTNPVSIFNSMTYGGTTSTSRASYADIYSIKLYNLETLVENLTPINVSDGQGGYYGSFYDSISNTTLSYKSDSFTKAAYHTTTGGSTAHEASKIYVGVNGEAKEVVKAYVGVNGEAKLFYDTTS